MVTSRWMLLLLVNAACGGTDVSIAPDPPAPADAPDAASNGSVDSGSKATVVPPGGVTDSGVVASDAAPASSLVPPAGASSGGSGGAAPVAGAVQSAQGVSYRLVVPGSYKGAATPLLIVFSGTEGDAVMAQNLISLGQLTSTGGFVRAVLDGVATNGNGQAGATVLDAVRAKYNIDNDRTYLIGESAGTTAALALAFHLRQSSFAAYWANDVTAAATPAKNASALGFAPWGQAGPGGNVADATAIVNGMQASGYRVPTPAPYSGAGANQHGSPDQFIAALSWLPGKSRQ